MEGATMQQGYIKRESHYPVTVTVRLTERHKAALKQLSHKYQISVAILAREAFIRGLPLLRESLRQKKRRALASVAENTPEPYQADVAQDAP